MTPQTLSETTPGRDLKRRFVWVGLAMVAGMVALAVQLYRLQITQGEEYAAKSVANFVKEVRLRADRGLIKDRRGTILVDSRPSFDAFVTPAFCTNCADQVLPHLGELLGWDEAFVGVESNAPESTARGGALDGRRRGVRCSVVPSSLAP